MVLVTGRPGCPVVPNERVCPLMVVLLELLFERPSAAWAATGAARNSAELNDGCVVPK